jgi:hypothetical protein
MHVVEAFIGDEIGSYFAAGALSIPLSVHVIRVDGGLHFQVIWQGITPPR